MNKRWLIYSTAGALVGIVVHLELHALVLKALLAIICFSITAFVSYYFFSRNLVAAQDAPTLDGASCFVVRERICELLRDPNYQVFLSPSSLPPPTASAPSDPVRQLLNDIVRLFCRDYIEYWYSSLSGNDSKFVDVSEDVMFHIIERLSELLAKVDVHALLFRDVVGALRDHFRSVRVNPRHFPSHPCLASPEAELMYLRQVSEVLLRHLLPPADVRAPTLNILLREILACQVLKYCADHFCDPDYINQYVIYRCDLKPAPAPAAARFAYATDLKGFLAVIGACTDVKQLRDMRFNIITEIMQSEHVQHLKREARRAGARTALAMVADTEKGAHLSGRDLHRYINQLRYAKAHCERCLAQRGVDTVDGTVGDIGQAKVCASMAVQCFWH
jgi:hypothetical protein